MSSAFEEALKRKAARAAAGANAMGAMLGAPVTPAAPAAPVGAAPDDVNPPDGDVRGVSGLATAPTDETTPEGEEEAAQGVVPTPPNPDAGYVAQAAVLPPETDKATGRKGRAPSALTQAQRKVAELSENPDHLSRMQGIDNALLTQLLAGKAPKSPEAATVEEVLRILDALENAKPMVITKGEALKTAEKESDNIRAQLEAARVAAVVAKDTLVQHTKRMRELEDDGDDDASERFRTEVRMPAQRALKSADQQVTAIEARLHAVLQKEATAEEARRQQEAAAAEKAAKATATSQREQAVEAVAAAVALSETAVAPLPKVSWGVAGATILVRGSVPTRAWKGAFVHIDDLINPYRRKAEVQAMTAYYGTMKTDSYAQICALLIQDVETGSYKLPALIVAPGRCGALQERVLEALSPYLFESFLPTF